MPLCDLCGENTKLVKAAIEGAVLTVCQKCAGYGKVLSGQRFDLNEEIKRKDVFEDEIPEPAIAREKNELTNQEESIIDDNYAHIIKTAREKAKLTQEELAKAIAEKENTIHRIETKQQEPSLKAAKKLEQFLHIKLVLKEKPKQTAVLKDIDFSETELTIGDLLKMKTETKEPSE